MTYYLTEKIKGVSRENIEKAVALEHEKVKLVADIPKLIDFLIFDEYEYRQEAVDKVLRPIEANEVLDDIAKRLATLEPFDVAGIEAACRTCAKDRGVKTGAVFHPLRVAISGRTEGPSLFHMVEYLGKARVQKRIKRVQALLKTTTA